jgi:hypothetical protein
VVCCTPAVVFHLDFVLLCFTLNSMCVFMPCYPALCRFYSCSQARLTSFTPHQLSATLAALGALTPDRTPPGPWATAVVTQVTARLADMSPPVLVDTLWGLMELHITPHRDLTLR